MAVRYLKTEQLLPITIQEAWAFFSSPLNLSKIKPAEMRFKILSELPEEIYAGLFINYIVAPVLDIPFSWTTEITKVADQEYFIDEQRIGPFALWHHEHHFKAVANGVLMTDILYYNIGKSVLGSLAGALFVDKKVKRIFDYRFKKLENIFSR